MNNQQTIFHFRPAILDAILQIEPGICPGGDSNCRHRAVLLHSFLTLFGVSKENGSERQKIDRVEIGQAAIESMAVGDLLEDGENDFQVQYVLDR